VTGWRECKLGDLLEIKHGYAFKGEYFAGTGTHVVLTPGNFFDEGGFKAKGNEEKWYTGPVPSDFVLNEGDLIVAMTEQAEGLLGSSARIPRSGVYLHNQRLGLVQVRDESAADRRFLYYLFNSRPVRAQIRASASGAKVRHTAPSRIAEVRVSVPSLPVQRRIAAILSAYDDLIGNNLQRIKIVEEMARTLYQEWFVEFRFPGHEKVRMVDSLLGKIPEGWEMRNLGELCALRKDRYEDGQHSDLPLLDLAKMLQRTLAVGEMGSPKELTTSRILFEEDDILFGSIRPYLHKVILAPCRGVTNISVLVIRPAEARLRSLLSVLLSSEGVIRWADQHSNGTKMPVIKWDVLEKMPVLVPVQSLLQRFQDVVQPMLQTIKITSAHDRNLRHTHDLLLPKLISGELDVSEIDIVVPVEVV